MKFLGSLLGVTLVGFVALLLAPYVIDWNSRYGNYVFEQLGASTSKSGITIRALGNIKGRFISPKLSVNNLYLECNEETTECVGTISVEKLELRLSFLSMIMGRAKVKSVDLFGLRTNVNNLGRIIESQTAGELRRVRVHDSVIVSSKVIEAFPKNAIHIRRGELKSSGSTYVSNAEFKIGNSKYDFVAKLDFQNVQQSIADIKVSSDKTRAVVTGIGNGAVRGRQSTFRNLFGDFEWVLDIKTSDLSELTQSVSTVTNIDALGYVSSAEELSLAARIRQRETGGFEIVNLNINGSSLSGNAVGACSADMACNMKLAFSSVDLDSLLYSNVKDVDPYYVPVRGSAMQFPMFAASLDASLELDIREIRYKGSVAKNLIAVTSVKDGKIAINRLLLDMPGRNNVLSISGSAVNSEDDAIPRFMGQINAHGDDIDALIGWVFPVRVKEVVHQRRGSGKFVLESGLYIAPRIISLPNISLASNRVNVTGNLKYKYGKRSGVLVGGIVVSNFSASDYTAGEYDIKRDIMRFRWLRSVTVPIQVSLKLQDFTIGPRNIKELSFLADISNRRLSMERVHFSATDSNNKTSEFGGLVRVLLSSQGTRPKILVDFSGDEYSSEFLWIPKFVERNEEAFGDDGKKKKTSAAKFVWSKRTIDLSSLEGVDGSVNIGMKKLFVAGRVLTKFSLVSQLKEGVMSVDNLSFRHGKGEVKISGNIGMGEVSSMSAVIAASNVAIGNVDSADTYGFSGNLSVSGSLQMQGRNLLEWANSVKGKLKFASRRLSVPGVDFDGFITDLFNTRSKAEIASLSRVYLYRGSTVFEQFDGEVQIERGAAVSSAQFKLKSAIGASSVSFMIPQFTVTSLCRFTFVPPWGGSPRSIDMTTQGHLWHPNPTFDIDKLFDIVQQGMR
ncbi:MAG: AsmA-like C-terminal region-containing protein [Aaplasma endosymbiont of Hyalomma asiaticum]